MMAKKTDYIEDIGRILSQLEGASFQPVLIGGMALVILGSRRVTRDFDFIISKASREDELVFKIYYRHGFELVSRVSADNEVITTIDNKNVAKIRLKLDEPDSAYFYNKKTGLRIDLLFDFPIPVEEILARAQIKKIRSHVFRIAAVKDLKQLKVLAFKNRALATDEQDLEFLRKLDKNQQGWGLDDVARAK